MYITFSAFLIITFSALLFIISAIIFLIKYISSFSSLERRENISFWNLSQTPPTQAGGAGHLIHDIRGICLKYIGILMDYESNILTMKEKHDLHSLLLPHLSHLYGPCSTGILSLSLLYRLQNPHCLNLSSFYKICKGHKNILILLRNNMDYVFGGFTSVEIRKCSTWTAWFGNGRTPVYDPFAFLIRIRAGGAANKQLKRKVFKFNKQRKNASLNAMQSDSDCLFMFGTGDLCMFKNDVNTKDYKDMIGYYSVTPDIYDVKENDLGGVPDYRYINNNNYIDNNYIDIIELYTVN